MAASTPRRVVGAALVLFVWAFFQPRQTQIIGTATKSAVQFHDIALLVQNGRGLLVAEYSVTRSCMAQRGFSYPSPRAFRRVIVERSHRRDLIGHWIPTLRFAQRNGFGLRIRSVEDDGGGTAQLRAYAKSLSPGVRSRFWGALDDSSGPSISIRLSDGTSVSAAARGCVAEAREAVYGSVVDALRLQEFANEIRALHVAYWRDPVVKTATGAYLGCLAALGYRFTDPDAFLNHAQALFGASESRPVTRAERRMAVAEARCSASSGVYDAIDRVVWAGVSRWVAVNVERVLYLEKVRRLAIQRARALLSSGGSV